MLPEAPPTAAEKSEILFISPAQSVHGAAVLVVVVVVPVVGGTYPQLTELVSIKLLVVPHCPSV